LVVTAEDPRQYTYLRNLGKKPWEGAVKIYVAAVQALSQKGKTG
jgi:hypothetical protein